MKLEIVERARGFDVCYGDQIVGVILRNHKLEWQHTSGVRNWDYFNPKEVQRLKSMVDDKIKLLSLTDRLTK